MDHGYREDCDEFSHVVQCHRIQTRQPVFGTEWWNRTPNKINLIHVEILDNQTLTGPPAECGIMFLTVLHPVFVYIPIRVGGEEGTDRWKRPIVYICVLVGVNYLIIRLIQNKVLLIAFSVPLHR